MALFQLVKGSRSFLLKYILTSDFNKCDPKVLYRLLLLVVSILETLCVIISCSTFLNMMLCVVLFDDLNIYEFLRLF